MQFIRATRNLVAAIAVAATAMSANATVFSGAGGPLIDRTTSPGIARFDIPIAGTNGTVATVNSVTVSLNHTFVGDTVIEIDSPGGAHFATLASPPDLTDSNYNGTYTFVVNPSYQTIDEVATLLTDTQDIPSGLYAPSDYGGGDDVGPRTDYTDFNGIALDGTWSLYVADYGAGDTGTLTGWSFDASYSVAATPEPASLAAIAGLGGLSLIRRRAR